MTLVIVRDLRTGVEVESQFRDLRGGEAPDAGVSRLVWSPDSKRLAYDVVNEGGWTFLFEVATRTTASFELAAPLKAIAGHRFGGPDILYPRWTERGELVVSLGCYGCNRRSLTAASDGGAVVAKLLAPRNEYESSIRTERNGWTLALERAEGQGGLTDVVVIAPDRSRTVIATAVRGASWVAPAPSPPATALYEFDIAAVRVDERLETRDNRLVARSSSGRERDVFRAHSPLAELTIASEGNVAFVVEENDPASCWFTIWRIPLRGGLAAPVADGRQALASPDGSRFVYRVAYGSTGGNCGSSVDVVEIRDDGSTLWGSVSPFSPGSGPLTIDTMLWSPAGDALVTTVRDRGAPWIYLWRTDTPPTIAVSMRRVASFDTYYRNDAELDGIFGSSGWGLGNPRFEGATLVADVVCLAGDRCGAIGAYQARGGEDGVFDLIVKV